MALKHIELSVAHGAKPTDPLKIFDKLTLRGSIGNIWDPQGEALRSWHEKRFDSDIVLQMNTGGGKTLVGLLIAQSIVNEKKERVLYVCPNNQLVEQSIARSNEVGLYPASRYKGTWKNREEFEAGEIFCITNYASVFNGRSIFKNEEIGALIFDDAHVAGNVIRGQFTLKISSEHLAFDKILHLFRKHFANSSQTERFEDISQGRFTSVLFVPMFVVWEHAQELRVLLLDSGINQDVGTKFVWEHLKEHLNCCAVMIDRNGIEITPVVFPFSQLNYFQNEVRRVYLTATLPSRASFARTFGIANPTIIKPSGKSGDAQRLFVFVSGEDDEEQRDKAKLLVENKKCCLISASHRQGQEWVPPAQIYNSDLGQKEIDRFQKSSEPEMLGLIARYDGIDLPGSACKILLLDRLPSGENLLNRFIDESIRVETIRISNVATRIVQAIGRIFRSNTDHGVVLLIGQQLQSWVRNPKNCSYLPPLLQKQLLLSVELTKAVNAGESTWPDLMEGILTGDRIWDDMYNKYIDQFETEVSVPTSDWHINLIIQEQKAYELLWQGQFQQASDIYATLVDDSLIHDYRLSAWYRHWCGLALLAATDRQGAFQEFITASNTRSELGRPSENRERIFKTKLPKDINNQAQNLATWYRKKKRGIQTSIEQIKKDLIYGPETTKAEEACKLLGKLLGLQATRPDKKEDTGPDVIWHDQEAEIVYGFELKTDKDKDGEYYKKDISQCHDHAEWLSNNFKGQKELIIIGPKISVSKQANPSSSLQIIDINQLNDLLKRAKSMFDAVEAGDQTNIEAVFQSWLNHFGLIWPKCVESLDSSLAVDLKQ